MIRALRRRHLLIFIALAVVLPVLFILGLRARPPEPVMDRIPGGLAIEGERAP